MTHLLVALSSHGFGHLAQAAPVLNALRRRRPDLQVTVRSTLPPSLLQSRIHGAFTLQPVADDFGMVQDNALDLDAAASAARYRDVHDHWEARVDALAAALREARVDLVFADVPYLTLAAAARAGVPSVAMCSLNWLEIYRHYCAQEPDAPRVLAEMQRAYAAAQWFLRPEPSMPMTDLPNTRAIGPLAEQVPVERTAVRRELGIAGDARIVLVAMGGFALPPEGCHWPSLEGVFWVLPAGAGVEHCTARPDILAIDVHGERFSRLLVASDLLLTKPGYGSFVEAALAGVPVLYVEREGWPEAPYLIQWLAHEVPSAGIPREVFAAGGFAGPALELLRGRRREPRDASGVDEAVEVLVDILEHGR